MGAVAAASSADLQARQRTWAAASGLAPAPAPENPPHLQLTRPLFAMLRQRLHELSPLECALLLGSVERMPQRKGGQGQPAGAGPLGPREHSLVAIVRRRFLDLLGTCSAKQVRVHTCRRAPMTCDVTTWAQQLCTPWWMPLCGLHGPSTSVGFAHKRKATHALVLALCL